MSFAALLSKKVLEKKSEQQSRETLVEKWNNLERTLLDRAIDLFKQRCVRAAEDLQCELTVSVEVLTREVRDFPTRVFMDSNWVVGTWGDGITAECWFYATHGVLASWSPGAPVHFAEVLAGIMTKFLDRVSALGFTSVRRIEGTWQVKVSWPGEVADGEEEEQEAQMPTENPEMEPVVNSKPKKKIGGTTSRRSHSRSKTLSVSSRSRSRSRNNGSRRAS